MTDFEDNSKGSKPVPLATQLSSSSNIRHNPSEVAEIIDNMFDMYCADPVERIAKVRQSLEAGHNHRLRDGLIEVYSDAEDIHTMAQPLINGKPTNE